MMQSLLPKSNKHNVRHAENSSKKTTPLLCTLNKAASGAAYDDNTAAGVPTFPSKRQDRGHRIIQKQHHGLRRRHADSHLAALWRNLW